MKTKRQIENRIENYKVNLKMAKRKKLKGALEYIRTAIKELKWVIE